MCNNYGFIIQARMGSKTTRKIIKKINKTPILGGIINSLKQETNLIIKNNVLLQKIKKMILLKNILNLKK